VNQAGRFLPGASTEGATRAVLEKTTAPSAPAATKDLGERGAKEICERVHAFTSPEMGKKREADLHNYRWLVLSVAKVMHGSCQWNSIHDSSAQKDAVVIRYRGNPSTVGSNPKSLQPDPARRPIRSSSKDVSPLIPNEYTCWQWRWAG